MRLRATRIAGRKPIRTAAAIVAAAYASAVAASVPVARYDFSDFAGMYQDNFGRTPVTAVEQPIGRINDKSRNFARGPETAPALVEGNWPTTSGTSNLVFTGTTVESAVASVGGRGRPGTITTGKTYEASFEIFEYVSGAMFRPYDGAGANSVADCSSNGVWKNTFVAQSTNFFLYSSNFVGKIRNLSIKEVPGNHLTQPTSTARPVTDARVNLMIQTEAVSNAVWTKVAAGTGTAPVITDNFALAPDGTTTATRVQMALNGGNTVGDQCTLSQGVVGLAPGAIVSSGVWLKTNDGTTKLVQMRDDLGTPSIAPILSITGTWQFFSTENRAIQAGASSSGSVKLWLRGAQGTSDSADLLFWHPQFEIGPALGRYQRVTTATTYDAVGFPVTARFDGVDDCLFSPVVFDMTSTNKVTVVAGLQKNSDAAAGIVVEFSPTVSTNAGSFAMLAPASAAANAQMAARGTSSSSATSAGIVSPIKLTLTGIADIAGSASTIRVNGTPTTVGTSLGTGNFGSYQLYVGRRANASVQFIGKIASIDIIGRLLSPNEQYNLERLARQKLTGTLL